MKRLSLRKIAERVAKKFKEHDLECILVGSACVTIYSRNRYQSFDLGFVTFEDQSLIKKALKELS